MFLNLQYAGNKWLMPLCTACTLLHFYCHNFYVCDTKNHTVLGCVHPWVSLRVLTTLWTLFLKHQRRDFHPVLATDVLWFIDVLIKFWGQKVKGQGHSRQKTGWIQYLCNYWSLFHQQFGHICIWTRTHTD